MVKSDQPQYLKSGTRASFFCVSAMEAGNASLRVSLPSSKVAQRIRFTRACEMKNETEWEKASP
jgi:hypothetical protein